MLMKYQFISRNIDYILRECSIHFQFFAFHDLIDKWIFSYLLNSLINAREKKHIRFMGHFEKRELINL